MDDFPRTEALMAMLAAARLGSMSGAAEELGVTHGAISRRVHALEVWLGMPIFERHGRGVRLTPVGAKLAKRVERSMQAITLLAGDIRATRRPDRVRVSVLPSFARLWLIPNLARLQGDPPDLDVQIAAEHRVASLEAREADLAVRVGRGDWSGVRAERIFGETIFPVGTSDLANATSGRPEGLLSRALLHDGTPDDWRLWFSTAGVPYRPRGGEQRFDDYDLALGAAAAGVGVALARMPLAGTYLKSAGLIRLADGEVDSGREHWLVMRPSEGRRPVLRLAERILGLGRQGEMPDGRSDDLQTPKR